MEDNSINKSKFLFSLIGSLALWATPNALASDGKAYPGTMCQNSGGQQELHYGSYSSGSLAANRTNSNQTAVCPFVRDAVTTPWANITVRVRDRHSTRDVSCQARAYDVFGQTVWTSGTVSSSGEGFQTLTLGAGLADANWGPFVVSCTLPRIEEANTPSYISSYQIRE